MKTGIEVIAAERQRQIEREGWTPEHDDSHDGNEMALAAIAYASPAPVKVYVHAPVDCGCREASCQHSSPFGTPKWIDPWPWDAEWDKRQKHDRIRRLAIAGALIAAEIDRLERTKAVDNAE